VARLTPLSLQQARELGRGFGLEFASVEALDLGSVNSNFRCVTTDGAHYFCRIYEEQGVAGAEAELLLLRELSDAGVPVALPVPRLSGDAVAIHDGKAVSVYPWLIGVHLCNALVTPDRTRLLGAALARVHSATPRLSALPSGRFGAEGVRQRLLSIEQDTDRFNDEVALLRSKLEHYLALREDSLPQGLIHGDLFRDNVLWREETLLALLDFESASRGTFVYDIAVCLWAWCYTDALRLDCARAFLDGYQSVRPLQQQEKGALHIEGALACVRFATTRIRDFAMRTAPGDKPGRDFRRFLQRLADLEAGAFDPLLR
jgi:homoserine kinase type II